MKYNIKNLSLKQHLILSLLLGLFLRILIAYFNYGPFALDDYLHGLIPAFLLENYHIHSLPEYRSWLLVYVLTGFLKIVNLFGVGDSLIQIRIMLECLGVFSLIGIIGCYLYVKNFNNRVFQLTALYLVAAYPLMPLISTRALGEAVAMSVLLFGVGIAENARLNHKTFTFVLGLVIIGISCLFRFQVAIFLFFYVACVLVVNRRYFLSVILSGLIILGLQAIIDLSSSREIFSTFIVYLKVNEGGAAGYGVTPWYSTWLLVLAFAFVPFSLPLFKNFKSLIKNHYIIFLPFFMFVLAHSLVPHKEERFMFPIVGVELIFLAWLYACSYGANWQTKLFKYAITVIGIPAVIILSFVNFQASAVDPMFESHANKVDTLILSDDWLPDEWDESHGFYPITISRNSKVEYVDLKNEKSYNKFESINMMFKQVVIVSNNPNLFQEINNFYRTKLWNMTCSEPQNATSFLDQVAYTLNPKHNQRRAPARYVICR